MTDRFGDAVAGDTGAGDRLVHWLARACAARTVGSAPPLHTLAVSARLGGSGWAMNEHVTRRGLSVR
ncbi:hypothetical protein CLV30_11640 [Haloactinopolyspora alba]|uniref:Uncharacterized protein n=1 Tax=Haloactinopolyspora alba TaxID=648780 RepID=A0A2P8DT37_9ACTN|nr:hypothetical protein CLV30_11640 [Haloactinopolyspora alba]